MSGAANVVVGKDGTVQFLHDDVAASLLQGLGPVSTKRASHVEPYSELSPAAQYIVRCRAHPCPDNWEEHFAGRWFADLGPSNGPVAGPFDTRTGALAFEKQWIEEHVLGVTSEPGSGDRPATGL